jgi:tetratricopeptide (TPR) repeat protein
MPADAAASRSALVVAALLLMAVVLVFGQTVRHEFVNFDDRSYVYENPRVRDGLTLGGIVWVFMHRHGGNWHPVTGLSHLLDCQLYGLQAAGHHLTNVALQAATAILLFGVFWRMTGGFWRSALVAGLFAIHPLRVESVAWVAERKDVLSGLLFMATLGAYVRCVRRPSAWQSHLLLAALFALGLMAKPMLVTLPLVLLLLDYWPLERFSFSRRLVIEKLPLFLLSVLSVAATAWAQREAIRFNAAVPVWLRIDNALVSYVTYVVQLFYPAGLAAYYPHPASSLSMGTAISAALVLAAVSAAAVACRRRCPYLLVGWFWYVVMLVPVIGFVQVGGQARADRYTYLPQIGLYVAIVWGAADLCCSWACRRRLSSVVSALVLAALMGCAWRQTCFWQDSETLWRHTLACTPPNSLAHDNFATLLAKRGQYDAAMDHYREAQNIQPNWAGPYDDMGATLNERGEYTRADACLRTALALRPDFAEAHYDLANTLVHLDQIELAIAHYRRALEIEPDYAEAHGKLANVLSDLGRWQEALTHYQSALEIDSRQAEAAGKLAWLLATCPLDDLRDGAKAVELAERATGLPEGKKAETLDALAAARAEAHQLPQALSAAREALDLARQQEKPALADAIRARIALYQAGKPYRQPRPATAH